MWITNRDASYPTTFSYSAYTNFSFDNLDKIATLAPVSTYSSINLYRVYAVDKTLLDEATVKHTLAPNSALNLTSDNFLTTAGNYIVCDDSLIISTSNLTKPSVQLTSEYSNISSIDYIWPLLNLLSNVEIVTFTDTISVDLSFGVDYYRGFALYPEDVYRATGISTSAHNRINTAYISYIPYQYKVFNLNTVSSFNNTSSDEFVYTFNTLRIKDIMYPIHNCVTNDSLGKVVVLNNYLLIPSKYV